jgi:gliding motility associated protien GldN
MIMYWLPFDSLRQLLTRYEAFNPQNDGPRMSWEDLLTMRMFESTIYKESNVYDRSIQEYATGTDALLESERISQELFEKEHDLWEY